MLKFIILIALCSFCVYIPNSGGKGFELPYNNIIIFWAGITVLCIAWRQRVLADKPLNTPLILIGAGLLFLPWVLYSGINSGACVLLFGMIIWYILISVRLTPKHKNYILKVIFFASLFQAVLGVIQTFSPMLAKAVMEYNWLLNHGRPYGSFQQVNLFASFVASGVGCGFIIYLSETRRAYRYLYLLGLGLLSFILVINQSRAGLIGEIVTLFVISLLYRKDKSLRIFTAFIFILFTSLVAWYIKEHVHIIFGNNSYLLAREYDSSTHSRWGILTTTFQMILQKPWSGWGYGNFEYAFSRWVLMHPQSSFTYTEIVTHPHNELLYAWFQGGIIALSGILILLAGWIAILIRASRTGRTEYSYALLVLPLLAHLCLEYPFYQSYVHFILFIVLLRIGVVDTVASSSSQGHEMTAWRKYGYCAVGILFVCASAAGLYTNNQLTKTERDNFVNFPTSIPWYFLIQQNRVEFDSMVSLLIAYNFSADPANLDEFMRRAEKWTSKHNDKNIYKSMMQILKFQGRTAELIQLQSTYDKLFPSPNDKDNITQMTH